MSGEIIRIGVGVLIWRQKQLLLGRRIMPDGGCSWQFPGGHLLPGESVADCARREVAEETGLQITALRHLGYTDRVFRVGGQAYLSLLVSAEWQAGEARVLEAEKCAGWQWFDHRQLPQPLFEPISLFLRQSARLPDLHALHLAAPLLLACSPASPAGAQR